MLSRHLSLALFSLYLMLVQSFNIRAVCFTCSEMAEVEITHGNVGKAPVRKKRRESNSLSSQTTKRTYCILCRRSYVKHVSGSTFIETLK